MEFGLSGGQKGRVAIARALLKNAPIIVLDDCTSYLDLETKSKIFENSDWQNNSIRVLFKQINSTTTELIEKLYLPILYNKQNIKKGNEIKNETI